MMPDASKLFQAIIQAAPARLDKLLPIDVQDPLWSARHQGETLCSHAAAVGETRCLQVLIQREANIHAPGFRGFSPLMNAALRGHFECADLLIQAGADLEARSDFGQSALMLAACNGHGDILSLLIERGARLDSQDPDGLSAAMWAAKHSHLECLDLLARAGANFSLDNAQGQNALDLARERLLETPLFDFETAPPACHAFLERLALGDFSAMGVSTSSTPRL